MRVEWEEEDSNAPFKVAELPQTFIQIEIQANSSVMGTLSNNTDSRS